MYERRKINSCESDWDSSDTQIMALYEMFSSKVTANNVMSSSTKCIIIIEAG
jgi:hypothetical protein